MPLPAGVSAQAVKSARALVVVLMAAPAVLPIVVPSAGAQSDVTDVQLVAASAGRVVRAGPGAGAAGRITTIPLEVYVARVIAGEGEPNAADAARQALAVAIRTFALANAARHGRDGFDVCDGTHCQVPRPATVATRRAALATAGQVLMYKGRPAELFYSASCGGSSESAAQVWPAIDYPYLRVASDDVHQDDPSWTLTLTLEQIERALERVGFQGRLRDVRIAERNRSGRAARLEVPGMAPDVIAGDQFRAAIGPMTLRSTAFSIAKSGSSLRFTGRGFGHGVGMCVIGAGRRAARGERMQAILAQYYPGLDLTSLNGP
ncbi:MAG: SpoIID/LytB domain-containing protein [Vicinamibacterales bacterium]